jgi:RNA polymerase-binding transcription factor DksA
MTPTVAAVHTNVRRHRPLSPVVIRRLSARLQLRVEVLQRQYDQLISEMVEAGANADVSDLVDDEVAPAWGVDRDSLWRLARTFGRLREETEAALGRIGRGDYGCCLVCGTDVPVVRLEALPTTSTCVRCG